MGEDDEGDESDLLIVRDNEFGTMEEDALRRDFTVNALFMDPVTDRIVDYVEGLPDVERRIIRCIGDPDVRFQEDPVRILRAAKFAGRLGFSFDGPTEEAMRATAPDLSRAAMPRVLEEILRLLRGGHALTSFQILNDIGALEVLLPVVAEYLGGSEEPERRLFWRTLEALDNHIHLGNEASNAVLLGGLFLRPVLHHVASSEGRSPTTVAEELIGPLATDLRLPRRDAGALKRICGVQQRFTSTGKRRFRLASFLRDAYLKEALDLFALSCVAEGENFETLESWQSQLAEHQPEEARPILLRAEPVTEPQARRTGRQRSEKGGEDGGSGPQDKRRRKKDKRKQDKQGKQAEGRGGKKDRDPKEQGAQRKKEKKGKDRKAKKRKTKKDEVQTLEPEALDLSAFDIELAPREVPRFDTFVDQPNKKKRRQPSLEEEDAYKPPPPPSTADAPPPPPPGPRDDVFGDW